jgi:hypothetical protein
MHQMSGVTFGVQFQNLYTTPLPKISERKYKIIDEKLKKLAKTRTDTQKIHHNSIPEL